MTNTNIQWAVNILEDNMEGMSKEEKINYLEDVAYKGCVTGCVSGAIYYSELDAIFTTHMRDILERLDEITEECGGDVLQAYMKKENKQEAAATTVATLAHKKKKNPSQVFNADHPTVVQSRRIGNFVISQS